MGHVHVPAAAHAAAQCPPQHTPPRSARHSTRRRAAPAHLPGRAQPLTSCRICLEESLLVSSQEMLCHSRATGSACSRRGWSCERGRQRARLQSRGQAGIACRSIGVRLTRSAVARRLRAARLVSALRLRHALSAWSTPTGSASWTGRASTATPSRKSIATTIAGICQPPYARACKRAQARATKPVPKHQIHTRLSRARASQENNAQSREDDRRQGAAQAWVQGTRAAARLGPRRVARGGGAGLAAAGRFQHVCGAAAHVVGCGAWSEHTGRPRSRRGGSRCNNGCCRKAPAAKLKPPARAGSATEPPGDQEDVRQSV